MRDSRAKASSGARSAVPVAGWLAGEEPQRLDVIGLSSIARRTSLVAWYNSRSNSYPLSPACGLQAERTAPRLRTFEFDAEFLRDHFQPLIERDRLTKVAMVDIHHDVACVLVANTAEHFQERDLSSRSGREDTGRPSLCPARRRAEYAPARLQEYRSLSGAITLDSGRR